MRNRERDEDAEAQVIAERDEAICRERFQVFAGSGRCACWRRRRLQEPNFSPCARWSASPAKGDDAALASAPSLQHAEPLNHA
jgi:hypothetical protein